MFVLLYFVPPFLAYRMGARGGWLWANILLSWPAFAVWLMVRAPDKELLRRREVIAAGAQTQRCEIDIVAPKGSC